MAFMISFSVDLDKVPAGFAAEAALPGTPCSVIQRAFLTTDDGEKLYTFLDGIPMPEVIREMARQRIRVELINNILINITEGTKAHVYLNFGTVVRAIAKRPLTRGSAVMDSDIADIRAVSFEFPMPTEGAIAYVFRRGWRWALYFDFSMLPDHCARPLDDLPELFGQFHNLMQFRDLFRMRPELLEKMYAAGWFPFIRLPVQLLKDLHSAIEAGFPTDNNVRKLLQAVSDEELVRLVGQWKGKAVFADHADLLAHAVERYTAGDYVSASHILAPRIEGILRSLHLGKGGKPKSPELLDGLVQKVRDSVKGPSAFLPEAFREYLRTFLYAGFDLETGQISFSRHSIAHGVTPPDQFDRVRAFQLLLIADQIAFYT
jgi:hypothetical protein